MDPFTGKSWKIEPGYQEWNPKLCKDYFQDLLNLPIVKSQVDFKSLGFNDRTAEVHKNDYVRISALNLYGGVWSDMDVIYFKPITDLKVNKPENKDKETYVCISPVYGHSTGFNMAIEGSQFFTKMVEVINSRYNSTGYQCWGPDMFNLYFKTLESIPNSVNIDMDAVYAHDCHHMRELLGNSPRFTDGSIGCHWYGGNSIWGKFFNETKGGEVNLPDNIIGNLIKNA